jgi:N-acetylglucosaminyl-diphospho-decaprenol L-rhamnosyltransferase
MMPDVTAVVVSWNTREHLARALAALHAAVDGLRVETIVVDNGSTDGSQAMVTETFPGVRLIQSPANVGFGRACNVGAASGTGRTVLLLNSDCELRPGALGVLFGSLDADPALGAVFARLVNSDGTLQPSVHDALPTPWSYAADVAFGSSMLYALYRAPLLKRVLLRGTLRRHCRPHDVAWGGAACMLVRRKAFEAVDGFDERFFMYMEDVDLCARLADAGFRLRFVPEAVAVHHWGVSAARSATPVVRHAYASRLAYCDKHFPGWGGGVAGALIAAELAVRATTLGLAARLTGSDALRERAKASAACRVDLALIPRARVPAAPALAVTAAVLIAAYLTTLARIAAESGFVDFAHYYAFGVHLARGGDLFDPVAAARIGDALGLRLAGAPLKYSPLFYVAMRPWTWLPFHAAALAWLALSQALLLTTAALLIHRRAAEPARVVALLALVALSQSLVETLHLGQANVFVLALLTLGWWAARAHRPWLAAVALGVSVQVKPQFGLPIAALWWIGQRALAYRAAGVAAVGVGIGIALVGADAYVRWARNMLAMPSYLHAWTSNIAPHAALHRLLDGAVGARVVEPLALAVSVAILALAARALRASPAPGSTTFDAAFGLAVCVVPLVAPFAEEHHLAILLLPLGMLVLAADLTPRAGVVLAAAAVLIGARYSLERMPALHTGLPSVLTTGKLAGVALLGWLLARRARDAAALAGGPAQ